MLVCYYHFICIFHLYFTRQCRDVFMGWWDI